MNHADDALPPPPAGARVLTAQRFDGTALTAGEECVAEEVAVALNYNGISHAVMMASPGDLEDFALGFSLSEGIVETEDEIRDIELAHGPRGITVAMQISERRMAALRERRRALTGRTGCGLCGAESLEQAIRPVARVSTRLTLSAQRLLQGFEQMAQRQHLNRATGAVHAASLLTAGELLVREDVGRHNALDKLIGAMQRGRHAADAVLVTSRASYEMVHKAACANLPLVAAISAPTTLAIELAQQSGITLIGFARGAALTCYVAGQARIEY